MIGPSVLIFRQTCLVGQCEEVERCSKRVDLGIPGREAPIQGGRRGEDERIGRAALAIVQPRSMVGVEALAIGLLHQLPSHHAPEEVPDQVPRPRRRPLHMEDRMHVRACAKVTAMHAAPV